MVLNLQDIISVCLVGLKKIACVGIIMIKKFLQWLRLMYYGERYDICGKVVMNFHYDGTATSCFKCLKWEPTDV